MVHVTRSTDTARAHATRFPRFEIHADRCPQLLARIVGLFAARALSPSELHARQSCAGLWIGLHLDVDRETAERLAEKMRAIVSVDAVILIHAPLPSAEIVGPSASETSDGNAQPPVPGRVHEAAASPHRMGYNEKEKDCADANG